VLDHEPGGGPEAPWPRLRSGPVARHQKKVRVTGCRNDLTCDTSSPRLDRGITPEPRLRFGQQLMLVFL
jgi:hypothetical protein